MNEKQQQLVLAALKSTDSYLGVLKDAEKKGGSEMHIHDFTQHYTNAHNALTALNKINQHEPYMKEHVGDMIKVANDEDTSLADEPYSHAPKGIGGDIDEAVGQQRSFVAGADRKNIKITGADGKSKWKSIPATKIYGPTTVYDPTGVQSAETRDEEDSDRKRARQKEKQIALANQGVPQNTRMTEEIENWLISKSAISCISFDVLLEVYNRAHNNEEPSARVNSYIMKGKAYQQDIDLHEKNDEISEKDMDKMVADLTWDDISDLFEDVEQLDEGISATSRLRKSQQFSKTAVKRNVQKGLKLNRTADLSTLKNRAKVAARRALMKRFLKGRNKSQLSAQEKDRLEQQIRSMKNVVNMMTQKMLPRISQLQQQRLTGRAKKK